MLGRRCCVRLIIYSSSERIMPNMPLFLWDKDDYYSYRGFKSSTVYAESSEAVMHGYIRNTKLFQPKTEKRMFFSSFLNIKTK